MNPLTLVFKSPTNEKIHLGSHFVEEVEANGLIFSKGEELVAAFHQKSNPVHIVLRTLRRDQIFPDRTLAGL